MSDDNGFAAIMREKPEEPEHFERPSLRCRAASVARSIAAIFPGEIWACIAGIGIMAVLAIRIVLHG